jgi:hypothetical protein
VGLFSQIENPPEPFWSRRTLVFAAAGLICYLLSRWVFTIDSTAVLIIVSIVRLSPLLIMWPSMRPGRTAWPIALATPYPFDLAFTAYSERSLWLPENLALEASNPTAFLIFTSGVMLASIPLTNWLVSQSVDKSITEELRYLGGLLFGLTAFAAVVSVPQISVTTMRYVVEPVALAGYAAVLGYGTRHHGAKSDERKS